MNTQAFLARLGDLLSCLPDDKIAETQAFYAEAIADRIEDGMTEAEAVASMGAPGAIAEEILDELPAVPRAIAKTRRKSTVLLWALAIIGSPIWLSLAVAFAAVAVSVYATIWICAACIWAIAVLLVLACPLAMVFAFWGACAGNIPFAIGQVGVGLIALGLGLACGLGAFAASRQLARLSRLWLRKTASPFKRERATDGEGSDRDGGGSAPANACATEQADAAPEQPTAPMQQASTCASPAAPRASRIRATSL